jgi:hypothetical protein
MRRPVGAPVGRDGDHVAQPGRPRVTPGPVPPWTSGPARTAAPPAPSHVEHIRSVIVYPDSRGRRTISKALADSRCWRTSPHEVHRSTRRGWVSDLGDPVVAVEPSGWPEEPKGRLRRGRGAAAEAGRGATGQTVTPSRWIMETIAARSAPRRDAGQPVTAGERHGRPSVCGGTAADASRSRC